MRSENVGSNNHSYVFADPGPKIRQREGRKSAGNSSYVTKIVTNIAKTSEPGNFWQTYTFLDYTHTHTHTLTSALLYSVTVGNNEQILSQGTVHYTGYNSDHWKNIDK